MMKMIETTVALLVWGLLLVPTATAQQRHSPDGRQIAGGILQIIGGALGAQPGAGSTHHYPPSYPGHQGTPGIGPQPSGPNPGMIQQQMAHDRMMHEQRMAQMRYEQNRQDQVHKEALRQAQEAQRQQAEWQRRDYDRQIAASERARKNAERAQTGATLGALGGAYYGPAGSAIGGQIGQALGPDAIREGINARKSVGRELGNLRKSIRW